MARSVTAPCDTDAVRAGEPSLHRAACVPTGWRTERTPAGAVRGGRRCSPTGTAAPARNARIAGDREPGEAAGVRTASVPRSRSPARPRSTCTVSSLFPGALHRHRDRQRLAELALRAAGRAWRRRARPLGAPATSSGSCWMPVLGWRRSAVKRRARRATRSTPRRRISLGSRSSCVGPTSSVMRWSSSFARREVVLQSQRRASRRRRGSTARSSQPAAFRSSSGNAVSSVRPDASDARHRFRVERDERVDRARCRPASS